MIATHTPKMFNARTKSQAVSARIEGEAPDDVICSRTTSMRKEVWAAPANSAHMKQWREVIAELSSDYAPEPSFPDITDPQLKQILVPVDWRSDRYVSVTPVASMGVMYELHERLYEQNAPFRRWTVQPTPAAMANHGEALLTQRGNIRLLRRGPAKITQGDWHGDFVQLTARCEGMNISTGMVAVGFPAITAIGGFVHSLERKIGDDIDFAFGLKSASWSAGVTKVSVYSSTGGTSTGRVKGGKVTPIQGYSTEEITASCEIVLLLRTKAAPEKLRDTLASMHKIAGGHLFDVNVSIVSNGTPPDASYLLDASPDVARKREKEGVDNLQAALDIYTAGGRWIEDEWWQSRNGYTLNQTGYAFLEQPVERAAARGNYPHAWAEPTFSLITQKDMADDCWWSRSSNEAGVFWKSGQSTPKPQKNLKTVRSPKPARAHPLSADWLLGS